MSTARVLACLRAGARLGVALFIALLLLVCVERRLAEAHFDLRSAVPGLENDDALDRDEIRVRLVAVKNDQLPVLPRCGSAFVGCVTAPAAGVRADTVPGVPAPRGPPLASAASLT